jgi:hypothetical protein
MKVARHVGEHPRAARGVEAMLQSETQLYISLILSENDIFIFRYDNDAILLRH